MKNELTWEKLEEELKEVNDVSKAIIDEADAMIKIISAINNRRHELGISQRELAKLCDIPQSSVARIEAKIVSPNVETLLKIMRPLGLTLSVVSINQ